jgi:hypothetical protein
VSEALPRGVALSHKGRWPTREAAGANVNVLHPGHKADMGESTCVHGVEGEREPPYTYRPFAALEDLLKRQA